MVTKTDKRDRAEQFRQRLSDAMHAKTMSQSGLARAIGVDRSTISQLLSGDSARLPGGLLDGATDVGLRSATPSVIELTLHDSWFKAADPL